MEKINYDFVAAQLAHWLACPPNGYLGSDYGIDLKQYLHKPMSTFDADKIIAKMKIDIPILALLPENSINIYMENQNDDSKIIYIQVMEKAFIIA